MVNYGLAGFGRVAGLAPPFSRGICGFGVSPSHTYPCVSGLAARSAGILFGLERPILVTSMARPGFGGFWADARPNTRTRSRSLHLSPQYSLGRRLSVANRPRCTPENVAF
jgi:hypothetical protein